MATDGYLTQPITADYIIIHSGERYDFLLRAKNSTELVKYDFIIHAEVLAIDPGLFLLDHFQDLHHIEFLQRTELKQSFTTTDLKLNHQHH